MGKRIEAKGISTILVVDDNESNRALAKDTLEVAGFRVLVATGGAEGIAIFEAERPDCIVLDVSMPEVDGFEVCERIRSAPGGADTPVIFLTALRDVDTFDRALATGGDDFLTKPVRPADLIGRVRAALKLRLMRSELHEHYELLKSQRDDMIRLHLQKERLTAFVVHDLKNPVSSMDMHAQLLQREKAISEDGRKSVEQIRTEARQLNRMILNLLDLSKADEGKLVPKKTTIDLESLASSVIDELKANADARRVTLVPELENKKLVADEDLLRRLLANLVENAIRHAPRDTSVTIRGTRDDGEVELRVIDAGTGVPEDLREKVFNPFVQLDGQALPLSRSGRGLGLSFCKIAAEAHGGKIWIEDAAPGAAFCVRLPDEQ